MARPRFSNESVRDLEEIWLYTAQTWSVEQADRYYHLIMEEVDFISKNPDSGRKINFIKERYRCTKVKSHVIFYKLDPDDIVLIVRILHQRMDVVTKLK